MWISSSTWPTRLALGAGLLAPLWFAPSAAAAQDDVELLGRMYGTRPPAAYYAVPGREGRSFEFRRAWKARNPRLQVVGVGADGAPVFDVRARPPRVGDGLAPRGGSSAPAPAAVLGRRRDAVEGTFRFPLVLGDFSDGVGPPPYSAFDVQREFFDGPNSRYKTVREYFDEVSGGRVTLLGETHGWVETQLTASQTTGGNSGLRPGSRVGLFIHQILAGLDDGSIDWGRYDNDGPDGIPNSGDDDGYVDVLAVLHRGFGAECGGTGQDARIWSHKFSLSFAWSYIPQAERPPGSGVFVTGSPAAAGGTIRIDDYTIQPVLSCDGTSINEIGVLAHELGHGFGLPDLYCTSPGCASHGIGRWGLMGSGGWGCGGVNDPARPCHMSAWSKAVLGWVEMETLDGERDHGTVALDPVVSSGRVVRIDALDGSDEYFLLENRQREGFDQGLVGTGLLVWQIDPDLIDARWPVNSVNGDAGHLGVWLRQADGRRDLEGGVRRADAGDPFPGTRATTSFHAGAAPASITHDGGAAGVTLVDITNPGGSAPLTFRAVAGFRTVTVGVEGSMAPGLVTVDDEPLPPGGVSLRRAPFEGVVLAAEAGEFLGPGTRRPFLEWSDDPGAARLRVLITPLEADVDVDAVYGSEEVEITPDVRGGILDLSPGSVVTDPPSPDLWVGVGEPVSIRAQAADGFAFEGWVGEWAGRPNPFSLTPLAPVTIGVEFGVTFSSLARALALGASSLPQGLRTALDGVGNGNGVYDVGDLRAYLLGGGQPLQVSADGVGGGPR